MPLTRLPWGIAIVRGPSMHPVLADGDRLLVRYGGPVRTGDLVLVRLPDGPDGPRPTAVKRLTRVGPDGGCFVESEVPGTGVDSWSVGDLPPTEVTGRVVRCRPGVLAERSAGRGQPAEGRSGDRPGDRPVSSQATAGSAAPSCRPISWYTSGARR